MHGCSVNALIVNECVFIGEVVLYSVKWYLVGRTCKVVEFLQGMFNL